MGCNALGPLKINKDVTDDPEYGPTPTWFDPAVITQPLLPQYSVNDEPGMFGYLGRNILTGSGRNDMDLPLLEDFRLPWIPGEKPTLQFRFKTF